MNEELKLKCGSFIPFSADCLPHHHVHKIKAMLASMHVSHPLGDHCTTVQLMPTARQTWEKKSSFILF